MPLQIIRQDIAKAETDAIVNTTNREMIGYSGVDHAIHALAGAELDAECKRLVPLERGEVKVTAGYGLKCRYIIHVRGPYWEGGEHNEPSALAQCYTSALSAAVECGCGSVAVPLISAGTYGYPKDQVLKLAIQVITDFLFDHEITVFLCVYDALSYEFSRNLFSDIQSFIDDVCPPDDYISLSTSFDNAPSHNFQAGVVRPKAARPQAVESCPPPPAGTTMPLHASLDDWLGKLDAGFSETLFRLIDERGMADVECYKKANVDRKTFWKIKNDPNYKPSKQTALAFAVALKLPMKDTQKLLQTVGMTLSDSFKFDIIVKYFILHGKYDLREINEALFEFDQPLLGCF